MEAEVLKQKQITKTLQELWIWLKYSMFLAGLAASVTFIRVNYFEANMQVNFAETPLLVVPNALFTDPATKQGKK